jgi:hypothetical protein
MAIDSIGSNTSLTYTQLLNAAAANNPDQGTTDTSTTAPVSASGKFADAISQTLNQLGVTSGSGTSSTSSTSSTSASQDSTSAATTFAQQLLAALQSQISGAGTNSVVSNGSSDASSAVGAVGAAGATNTASATASTAVASTATAATPYGGAKVGGGGGHHHHGGGGGGKVEGGLQSLMDQLGSNTDGSVATAATTVGADATDAADVIGATPTTAATGASTPAGALQSSYNSMVAASGNAAGAPSLSQFLQTLSQNLHGAPTSGNVVSTQA